MCVHAVCTPSAQYNLLAISRPADTISPPPSSLHALTTYYAERSHPCRRTHELHEGTDSFCVCALTDHCTRSSSESALGECDTRSAAMPRMAAASRAEYHGL